MKKPGKKSLNLIFGAILFICIAVFGLGFKVVAADFPRAETQADQSAKTGEWGTDKMFELPKNSADNYQKEAIYFSEIYPADFVFSAVGAQWQEGVPTKAEAKIYLRILENDRWGEWGEIKPMDETTIREADDRRPYFSNLIFAAQGQAIQYKIELSTKDLSATPIIQNLKITYFNSFFGEGKLAGQPRADFKMSISGLDETELNIIYRDQWLDQKEKVEEQDRKNSWPEEYAEPEKIIVHHTGTTIIKDVNNDGRIDSQDYLATMKAIYRWQAKVIEGGWRDIGYNFLIDPDGRIYEGRYGRDGVTGGHTVRSEQCDSKRFGKSGRVVGFNRGTIGIALMGDFETETPTSAAINSLVNLISYKAVEFDLEPAGSSFFVDMDIPNILGHRDVDCTLCPGDSLHGQLPLVRQQSQQKYEELRQRLKNQGISPKAALLYQSEKAVILKPGETKEIWADFKNEGNTTWHNYTQDSVYLAEDGIKSQLASLDSLNLATVSEGVKTVSYDPPSLDNFSFLAGRLVQPNVRPGETGTFKFTLNTPLGGNVNKNYILTWGEKGWFPNTDFAIALNATDWNYSAQLVARDAQSAYFVGSTISTEFRFRNTGLKAWPTDKIILNIYGENKAVSLFKDAKWPADFGSIKPVEFEAEKTGEILPGQEVTFKFNLKIPAKPNLYKNIFKLELSGGEEQIYGGEFNLMTRVDAPLAAELVSNTIPSAVLNGWRPDVFLRFKNTGTVAWDKNLALESFDENNKPSLFRHPEWKSDSVVDKLGAGEVKPGETVTFMFKLKPPQKIGEYKQMFVLKMGGKKIFINGDYSLSVLTRVDGPAIATTNTKTTTTQKTAVKTAATKVATVAAKKTTNRTHIVKAGESLGFIAQKYGVGVSKIISANKLKNENRILVGQKLIIPN